MPVVAWCKQLEMIIGAYANISALFSTNSHNTQNYSLESYHTLPPSIITPHSSFCSYPSRCVSAMLIPRPLVGWAAAAPPPLPSGGCLYSIDGVVFCKKKKRKRAQPSYMQITTLWSKSCHFKQPLILSFLVEKAENEVSAQRLTGLPFQKEWLQCWMFLYFRNLSHFLFVCLHFSPCRFWWY